ncbi:hypothetical protein B7486_72080, partial [cyanobacterium TDX16]
QPGLPLRGEECRTFVAQVDGVLVARRCDDWAVRLDQGWAVIDAPDGSLNGSVAGGRLYVSADDGIWAYRPPDATADAAAVSTSVIPVGTSELTLPEGASIVSQHGGNEERFQRVSLELTTAEGATCVVTSSTDPSGAGLSQQIELEDGSVVAGFEVIGVPSDPNADETARDDLRGVGWYWDASADQPSDRVEVVCDDDAAVADLVPRLARR